MGIPLHWGCYHCFVPATPTFRYPIQMVLAGNGGIFHVSSHWLVWQHRWCVTPVSSCLEVFTLPERYSVCTSLPSGPPRAYHLALSLWAHITHVLIHACAKCSHHVYIATVFPAFSVHQISDHSDQFTSLARSIQTFFSTSFVPSFTGLNGLPLFSFHYFKQFFYILWPPIILSTDLFFQ